HGELGRGRRQLARPQGPRQGGLEQAVKAVGRLNGTGWTGWSGLAGAVELAFPGYALEGLACALDPVAVLIAFERQQLDDAEVAAHAGTPEGSGVSYVLANRKLVRLELHTCDGHRRPPEFSFREQYSNIRRKLAMKIA